MAWRFPRHRVSDNSVIEIDDVNENFRSVAEEASGALNEHNWEEGSWNDRLTDLSDGVGMRAWSSGMLAQPGVANDGVTGSGNGGVAPFALEPTQFMLKEESTWQPIDDLTLTIESTGGTLWILSSMATRLPWFRSAAFPPTFSEEAFVGFGAMFAIRVDGKILAQSLVGSGDLSNDEMTTTNYRASPPGSGILSFNSPAPTALHAAICVEALVTVTPGQHVIEVVAMTPQVSLPRPYDENEDDNLWWRMIINSRQVVALEIRR